MIITNWRIFLQVLLLISFSLPGSEILYLKGTCSAGKSTLISTFPNSYEVIDEDAIMHRNYVDAVASRFPDAFRVIQRSIAKENLYHALREKDVLFKDGESPEALDALYRIQEELNQDMPWRKAVSKGIDDEVLRKIKDAVQQSKNVVLDSWYISKERLACEFPDAKITKVLLYCPLPIAYQRFLKRNREAQVKGDLSEKRYLRQLVGSYFSLYQIVKDPNYAIHKITRHDLEPVLDAIANDLTGDEAYKKSVFTFENFSKGQFLKMKGEFLRPFDETADTLYLAPKDRYDCIQVSCDVLQRDSIK